MIISGVIYYKEFNIPNAKQQSSNRFHNGHYYYFSQLGNLKNQQSSQMQKLKVGT
jgi:hypothetical protein